MTDENINIEKYDFDSFEIEKSPYVTIPTNIVQQLPYKFSNFFLIWIYLQSLPPSWKVRKTHLAKHFDISIRTLERALSWLHSTNLIDYRQGRNVDGSFRSLTLLVLNGSRFKLPEEINRTDKFGGPDTYSENIHDIQDDRTDKFGGAVNATKPLLGADLSAPPNLSYNINNIDIINTTPPTEEKTQSENSHPISNPRRRSFFSKTIDQKILEQKLPQDSRTDEEFLEVAQEHVDRHSCTSFPRLQRARALVKLLHQYKQDGELFQVVSSETQTKEQTQQKHEELLKAQDELHKKKMNEYTKNVEARKIPEKEQRKGLKHTGELLSMLRP